MARFGLKSLARRNRKGQCASPVCLSRIVARFGREGKSADAPEIAPIQQFRMPSGAGPEHLAHSGAIVVLVDRGGAMIATRPDPGISPSRRIQPETGPRAPENVP